MSHTLTNEYLTVTYTPNAEQGWVEIAATNHAETAAMPAANGGPARRTCKTTRVTYVVARKLYVASVAAGMKS